MIDPTSSTSLERSALADRAYELLRARIIDLELEPGARLNADRLAAELQVSPTPVREALNRLSAEGMVTAAPYRGFRVSPLLRPDELMQLLRTRVVLEEAALGQAAQARDDAALQRLGALVSHMDQLAADSPLDVKTFNAVDAEFHRLTVAASGNRFLLQAFDSLHTHVQIARHYQGRSVAEARRANAEHHAILIALRDGDPAAAVDAARDHVEGVLSRLRVHLESHRGDADSEDG